MSRSALGAIGAVEDGLELRDGGAAVPIVVAGLGAELARV
jgi:hypothetical protein